MISQNIEGNQRCLGGDLWRHGGEGRRDCRDQRLAARFKAVKVNFVVKGQAGFRKIPLEFSSIANWFASQPPIHARRSGGM